MRFAVLVLVLAACSSSAAAGPRWPAPRAREVDGGESLAPRPAARAILALVEEEKPSDKPADKVAARPAPDKAASVGADKAAPPPPPAPPDEPIMTEDLVIEIED
jgi:hypothetical protein